MIKKWFRDDLFRRLAKNVSVLVSGNVLASVFGLVSMTIAIKSLGAFSYGTFVVIQTYILSVDGLLNFQAWQALIKFGSTSITNKNEHELKKYIKFSFLLDITSALIGTVCALVFIDLVGNWLEWDSTTRTLAAFFSLFILFHIYGTPIGILRLFDRFKLISIQKIAMSLLKVIVLVILVLVGITLESYVIAVLAVEIFGSLLLIVFALYTLKAEKIVHWTKVPLKGLKEFFIFSIWSNLNTTISLPIKQFDKIIVAKLVSKEALAVYDLFKKISQILSKFINPIYQAVYPELAKLIALNKLKKAVHSFYKIAFIIFGVSVLPVGIFSLFSGEVLQFLFSEEYVKYWYVLSLYVTIRMFGVSFTALDPLVTAMGMIKYRFWITLGANSLYMVCAWFLGSYYGIMGVTLALAFQTVLTIGVKLILVHSKNKVQYGNEAV